MLFKATQLVVLGSEAAGDQAGGLGDSVISLKWVLASLEGSARVAEDGRVQGVLVSAGRTSPTPADPPQFTSLKLAPASEEHQHRCKLMSFLPLLRRPTRVFSMLAFGNQPADLQNHMGKVCF